MLDARKFPRKITINQEAKFSFELKSYYPHDCIIIDKKTDNEISKDTKSNIIDIKVFFAMSKARQISVRS